MSAAVSRSEYPGPLPAADCAPPSLERAQGRVRITVDAIAGRSHPTGSYQQGSLKVRFPRQFDTDVPEAVLINTAGGITGGDRFDIEATVTEGAALTLTSQAAEKIYRSAGGEGRVDVSLRLLRGATAWWLPQETIVFDAGRLARRLTVEMESDARLVLSEMTVLGRTAHGETIRDGDLADHWRVRRGGKLVYADNLRLRGSDPAAMGGGATLGDARCFASVLVVAPDCADSLERARTALSGCAATAGASAWNGMLAVRLVTADSAALRLSLNRLFETIGVRVPRAWSI